MSDESALWLGIMRLLRSYGSRIREHFQGGAYWRLYPQVSVESGPCRAVGQAGGVLLTRTVNLAGLGGELSTGLARWRKPFAVHDPGKILTDLAVSLAFGWGLPG